MMHLWEWEQLFHYVLTGIGFSLFGMSVVMLFVSGRWEYLVTLLAAFVIFAVRLELTGWLADRCFMWHYRKAPKQGLKK